MDFTLGFCPNKRKTFLRLYEQGFQQCKNEAKKKERRYTLKLQRE